MVFADTHVKHGAHAIVADRSIAELTRDVEFFGADAVIATGQRTGDPVDLDELALIARSTRLALLVGSGVNSANFAGVFQHADGVIIGSFLKRDGVWWNPVEQSRVSSFMQKVAELRERRADSRQRGLTMAVVAEDRIFFMANVSETESDGPIRSYR